MPPIIIGLFGTALGYILGVAMERRQRQEGAAVGADGVGADVLLRNAQAEWMVVQACARKLAARGSPAYIPHVMRLAAEARSAMAGRDRRALAAFTLRARAARRHLALAVARGV